MRARAVCGVHGEERALGMEESTQHKPASSFRVVPVVVLQDYLVVPCQQSIKHGTTNQPSNQVPKPLSLTRTQLSTDPPVDHATPRHAV